MKTSPWFLWGLFEIVLGAVLVGFDNDVGVAVGVIAVALGVVTCVWETQ